MPNNKKYNLVAENSQSTVVGEYVADGVRVAHYQSEADLERAFIKQLETQAYEYLESHRVILSNNFHRPNFSNDQNR